MKEFKEVQNYIVDFATSKGACSGQLIRAKNAKNPSELIQVVKDNIGWTVSNNLYDYNKMQEHFGMELMIEFGLSNSGDGNTGFYNTGDRNTGYSNTGYSNTGYSNTGAFCTGESKIKLFNKESDLTHEQFISSRVYDLLCEVDTKMWVFENSMTDEEKQKFPSYKTAGGYLKDIPFKEAFGNRWHNWSESNRIEFTSVQILMPQYLN